MLHDAKLNNTDLATHPLPTSTWIRIASLLNLPPEARPGFERLWWAYGWNVTRNREAYEIFWACWFFIVEADQNYGLIEFHDPPDPPFRKQYTRQEVDEMRKLMNSCRRRIELSQKEPPQSRLLVLALRKMFAYYTGKRPHHGEKWLAALTEVCQAVDPAITKWQVEDALHPRSRRRRSN